MNTPSHFSTDDFGVEDMFDEFGNFILDSEQEDTTKQDIKHISDSNGNPLQDGDTVIITQDIKSKNSKDAIKRGTVIKNIKLCDEEDHIMCKIGKTTMYIRTCFVKKK